MNDDGSHWCPECGAPAAGTACTQCGYRPRPSGPDADAAPADPAETADLAADALTVDCLQAWCDQQPPGSGLDAHPDARDAPLFGRSRWTATFAVSW